MIEQHTLDYVRSNVYLNGNRAQDILTLVGPDAAAPCRSVTCTASWEYDARDRLVQEIAGTGAAQTTSYTLDTIGNVTQELQGPTTITRSFTGQRLVQQTGGTGAGKYFYDAFGNVDCVTTTAYAGSTCAGAGTSLVTDYLHDYKNRLQGYGAYSGATLTDSASYTLDALDRPVTEVETHSGTTTTTQLAYVGETDAVHSETLTGGTATTRRYGYDALGQRLTLTDGAGRYSYLFDPHGSASLLIDHANAVKASYGYLGYGTHNTTLTRTAAGFNALANAYRYTGKRKDTGTRATETLYDMGARRYSADAGRWLQQDQYSDAQANLGLAQDPLTANRYQFTGGNPVNYVEIDGHRAVSEGGCGLVCEKPGVATDPSKLVAAVKAASGWNDAVACRSGSVSGCVWAGVSIVPLGRVGRIGRAAVWGADVFERGRTIERTLGATLGKTQGWGRSLDELCGPRCNNFPVADFWNEKTGRLTSVKSISSTNERYVARSIERSAGKLASFEGARRGGALVRGDAIRSRSLVVAIPRGYKVTDAIRRAASSTEGVGVSFVRVP